MQNAPNATLHRLLGNPGCQRLLKRLRKRLERGQPLTGRLVLQQPSATERAEIENLMGRRPGEGDGLSVSLDELDVHLRSAGLADSLENAVISLTGPVKNRKAEKAREEKQWAAILSAFDCPGGALPSEFLATLHTKGLLKRLRDPETARERLAQLENLAQVLPAPARGEPLAQLAARLFGDSHALDPGQPLANLALRLIPYLAEIENDPGRHSRRRPAQCLGLRRRHLRRPQRSPDRPESSRPERSSPRTAPAPRPCLRRTAPPLSTPTHPVSNI